MSFWPGSIIKGPNLAYLESMKQHSPSCTQSSDIFKDSVVGRIALKYRLTLQEGKSAIKNDEGSGYE